MSIDALVVLAIVIGFIPPVPPPRETPVRAQQSAAAPSPPASSSATGSALAALSQQQMFEDFDALVRVVRDVLPTAAANRAVYGLDVFESLAAYRKRIPDVGTTAAFIDLVDRAISACKGSHFEAASLTADTLRSNEALRAFVGASVTESALEQHAAYNAFLKEARPRNALNIPLFYLRGRYYVRHDFAYGGRTYPRGLTVVACNGKTPGEIVSEMRDTVPMLPWDFERRHSFSSSFYTSPAASRDGAVSFVFEDAAGRRVDAVFPADAKVTFDAPSRATGKAVAYLDASRILYIRVPLMNPDDTAFYKTTILQAARGKTVTAAVIDIRGNGGGSDDVWRAILAALLERPVRTKAAIGVRNTDVARRYFARHPTGRGAAQQGTVKRLPFLDDEEFLVVESEFVVTPDADSLKVPIIFVLTSNVFSAAGSLTTLARLVEPVVSVGIRNPYILGRGIDPFLFSLPHSGFTFRIEPVVDLTGARAAADVFHTEVEIEVRPTVDQMLAFYNDRPGPIETFLSTSDPFFRKVLGLLADTSTTRSQEQRK